jgi:hypothetical protein
MFLPVQEATTLTSGRLHPGQTGMQAISAIAADVVKVWKRKKFI